MQQIKVECYSGYKADERPLRFLLGEKTYEVTEVCDSWYSPGVKWFRVLASDGNIYVLRHDEGRDLWTLEAYRSRGRSGA
jgi:hypothetical protein